MQFTAWLLRSEPAQWIELGDYDLEGQVLPEARHARAGRAGVRGAHVGERGVVQTVGRRRSRALGLAHRRLRRPGIGRVGLRSSTTTESSWNTSVWP